jgi:phosphatidylethanolamine-binding protein (PEBP) family uncharacterized protein
MRRCPAAVFASFALLTAPALSGCGGSSPGPSDAAPAKVTFTSSAVVKHILSAQYTCDGKNVSPPLEWGAIPADTGELVLAEASLTPVPQSTDYNVKVEWAVAGINPALHKLAPGQLPPKAHIGLAANGRRQYSLCPKKGTAQEYQFLLFGVPAGARVAADFADEPVLADLTKAGARTYATAEGAFALVYVRKGASLGKHAGS